MRRTIYHFWICFLFWAIFPLSLSAQDKSTDSDGKIELSEFINNDLFNLSLRPGVNYSSLSVQGRAFDTLMIVQDADFGSKISWRLGVEAEIFLPFSERKWAIIFEPTYQYFESAKWLPADYVVVNYSTIELPVGLRRYFNHRNNSSLFLDASAVFDINNGTLLYQIGQSYGLSSNVNFSIGAGFNFGDKFSVEIKYFSPRNILKKISSWNSEYRNMSFVLGYTFI